MKPSSIIVSILLAIVVPVTGFCADEPKAPDAAAPPAAKVETKTKPAAEAVDLNPSGTVVETMTGGGYTYARLDKDGKSVWVAYSALDTRVGEKLSFRGCGEMRNFPSRTLKRTFDSILFCGAPMMK